LPSRVLPGKYVLRLRLSGILRDFLRFDKQMPSTIDKRVTGILLHFVVAIAAVEIIQIEASF
jgi:hypothetical protein